ncbi:hypothetical protein EJ03DRAFT_66844 [Teratosphaeria nubilosa]|uniref:CBM1 domain-containing protein n=1 Tax=Teratosphaeria nubilosa TaxID=161662 RepID=A0A6G1LCM7_9PEZI|nr:hypothetical protein EJ03DRAFT_66844 [Teratosphaeria nubilosa]
MRSALVLMHFCAHAALTAAAGNLAKRGLFIPTAYCDTGTAGDGTCEAAGGGWIHFAACSQSTKTAITNTRRRSVWSLHRTLHNPSTVSTGTTAVRRRIAGPSRVLRKTFGYGEMTGDGLQIIDGGGERTRARRT